MPFGVLLAKAKAIAKEDEAIANEEEAGGRRLVLA